MHHRDVMGQPHIANTPPHWARSVLVFKYLRIYANQCFKTVIFTRNKMKVIKSMLQNKFRLLRKNGCL